MPKEQLANSSRSAVVAHASRPRDRPFKEGRWSCQEHALFLKGIMRRGRDWNELEKIIETRVCSQVRSHAQKFFSKLNKILKQRKKQQGNRVPEQVTNIEKEINQVLDESDICPKSPSEIVQIMQASQYDPPAPSQEGQDLLCQAADSPYFLENQPDEVQIDRLVECPYKPLEDQSYGLHSPHLTPELQKHTQNSWNELERDYGLEEEHSQSYLMSIMKHHKLLEGPKFFQDLIDFGDRGNGLVNNLINSIGEPWDTDHFEVGAQRKTSFTLYEENETGDKLEMTLQKVRKGEER